jgi:hypothetical protein
VLLEQLDCDDERRRFEAAKSLFSYRAAAPPAGDPGSGAEDPIAMGNGRKIVGLADVLEFCVEEVPAIFDSARMQVIILRAAERVRELQARALSV